MPSLADHRYITTRYSYNPETGELTTNVDARHLSAGDVVTAEYLSICKQKVVRARVIWFHYYGEWPADDMVIDHKDTNHNNNCIDNLRLATKSQNAMNWNRKFKGVYKVGNRWAARLTINRVQTHLGCYNTKEEAAQVYITAAKAHHGEFACQV